MSDRPTSRLETYACALGMVALLTAGLCLGRGALALLDIVLLYVLAIVAVGALFGRGPCLIAAALSVAAYDFFFVPPVFAFRVDNFEHLATFALMFGVGCAVGAMSWRSSRRERNASRTAQRTRALAELASELNDARSELDASRVIARRAAALFDCAAAVVGRNLDGKVDVLAQAGCIALGPDETEAVRRALAQVETTGLGTNVCGQARITCWPLQSGGAALRALALPAPGATERDSGLVEAFAYQSALALARVQRAQRADAAPRQADPGGAQRSLLGVVSHDLRAPLAVITGAATALKDNPSQASAEERAEIAATIRDEAERIERLVSNLFEMTRMGSHGLELRPEPLSVDEIVSTVLTRLKTGLHDRPVTVDLPDALPPLVVDRVLIGQVFLNLLDNIAKYTPAQSPVEIRIRASGRSIDIEIADRGPGLVPGSEELVFDTFYRGTHPGTPGSGLGLSICRGIVEAHGGKVSAHNAPQGGAVFLVSLPTSTTLPS